MFKPNSNKDNVTNTKSRLRNLRGLKAKGFKVLHSFVCLLRRYLMRESSIRPSKMVLLRFAICFFPERASVSLVMFSAKQGKFWYHFFNVFGMTRLFIGD